MEIGLFYSRKNSSHRRTATFVKKAVKNLGISAKIIECDSQMSFPKIVVDGFDLTSQLRKSTGEPGSSISYDMVEKALEQTAW